MAQCEQCGTVFIEVKSWQRFCQPSCRDRWNYLNKKREERTEDRVNGYHFAEQGRSTAG